ncbi:CIC11C00000000597 [Sungouiella intermedia]|uniref:CIC11C00000000597 n=1 Tax=Sungouiella intermedia TaxID=45354 RepID=A0A1L0C0Y0_9ASCO|nr:CIC11C00000000597 [[Candida] intermedia]
MGVTGLLQQIKDIQEPISLSKYKGKTLAVDTYGWLHRGLILCAQDLCTDAPTRGYVTSVMKKVDMLRHFGVEPYMVFDGSPLPTKEGTHLERKQKREKAREEATNLMKKGNRKLAWKEFMKAAAVTPEMAKSVMVELDRKHVKYVVAPYEADPQMVYLEKLGLVDGILSEDSDLLVFGCTKLITKLNDYGECIEIDRNNLVQLKRMPYLATFTPAQWRLIAILSGCDYTKGIPGVGLKTAFNIVQKLGSLDKIVASLKADNKIVPDDFMEEALRADLAFQYQKVFDPLEHVLRTLNDYSDSLDIEMEFVELCCGRTLEKDLHAGICTGKVHPESHGMLISREQNLLVKKSNSMIARRPSLSKDTATKSQSFGPSKSIESYFKVEKSVKITNTPKLDFASSKRINDGRTKLSPTSKKLRSIETQKVSNTTSKFFSQNSTISIQQPAQALSPKDSSFLTGDSEVPESSPVKIDDFKITTIIDEDLKDTNYLTDMDDECVEDSLKQSMMDPPILTSTKSLCKEEMSDDGYENDIDESPVKRKKIGILWREKFLMDSNVLGELLGNAVAFKKDIQAKISREITDSSLSPSTPTNSSEELKVVESDSQVKSLQREEYILSESEDDLVTSVTAPPSTTLKLLRFAFTR